MVGSDPSRALLGGLAIGARAWLLWQHTSVMRSVGENACTRCMAFSLVKLKQHALTYCLKLLKLVIF